MGWRARIESIEGLLSLVLNKVAAAVLGGDVTGPIGANTLSQISALAGGGNRIVGVDNAGNVIVIAAVAYDQQGPAAPAGVTINRKRIFVTTNVSPIQIDMLSAAEKVAYLGGSQFALEARVHMLDLTTAARSQSRIAGTCRNGNTVNTTVYSQVDGAGFGTPDFTTTFGGTILFNLTNAGANNIEIYIDLELDYI